MQMRSLRRRPRHLALQSLTRGLKGKIPFLCKESKFPFCKKKGILSATSFSDRIPLKKDGNFVREFFFFKLWNIETSSCRLSYELNPEYARNLRISNLSSVPIGYKIV